MTPVPADESTKKRSASDFIFGKWIGEGSFSNVYLAKDIHTNKEFAIKVLVKRHIKKEKKIQYVMRERDVLLKLAGCNNLFVRLYCTFQDNDRLYFVLTYAKNSDLEEYTKRKVISLESARFYAAQILQALEILNSKNIIHRDLKPENILLDENWNILLTDFGSSKIVDEKEASVEGENVEGGNSKRRNSFVGTAQYVTPEVLQDGNVCYASDLWALGCVIYQMISGSAPFQAQGEYLIFKKIVAVEYVFPENFDSSAKDLVERLLVKEPSKRLGATDDTPYASIRGHEFFRGINWDNLGSPPPLNVYSEENEQESLNEELEPGFDEERASRLQLQLFTTNTQYSFSSPTTTNDDSNITSAKAQTTTNQRSIADLDKEEIERRLEIQKGECWHSIVEGNLILKQGLIDKKKKKAYFPRRRMLLLTLGPHLYYVDPVTTVLKGEIPWSADLKPEAKNFKTFYVHTPNRIYYLEDPEGFALEWCKAIEEVKSFYYS